MDIQPAARHLVTIAATGRSFRCAEDSHVLAAMEQSSCRDIPVGCRNGGCGACKVRVTSGRYHTGKMNRAVISAQDEAESRVLACKTYPQGDLTVEVLGRVWQPERAAQAGFFSYVPPAAAS